MIDVSICIVSWNTSSLIKQCLQSIYKFTSGISFEVVIVDNGSTDGTIEMIQTDFPQCHLIKSSENLGFTKGNNLAVKNSSGRYILYLNPDTELISNSIYMMVKFLDENSDYGAVGPRLVFQDRNIQYVCARTFPTPKNQFNLLAMLDRIFTKSKFFSTVEMRYWDHKSNRDIDCLSGACILTRKEIVDMDGGFDENIFMYAEDVDFCYRILKSGWKIFYLADETIIHYAGSSSKKRDTTFFSTIMQRESNIYFLNKHFGKRKAIAFILAVLLGSLIRVVIIFLALPLSIFKIISGDKISIYTLRKYSALLAWSVNLENFSKLKKLNV